MNLESGMASPLVGAPAGRSLFFNFVPTKAIWANDGRHVLISNTFLPTDPALNSRDQYLRHTASAVAIVDIVAHAIQTVTFFQQPPKSAEPDRHASEVTWDRKNNRVDLAYASSPDNVPLLFHELYRLGSTGWNKAEVVAAPDDSAAGDFPRSESCAGARCQSRREARAGSDLGSESPIVWPGIGDGVLVRLGEEKVETRLTAGTSGLPS